MHRIIASAGGIAAAGSILGAVSHDELLTWLGVGIAVASALISAGVAAYHKVRSAARDEDKADREAVIESMRQQLMAQIALETKVEDNRAKLADFQTMYDKMVERFNRERCPYLVEGVARCAGEGRPHAAPQQTG